jgi:ParB-like chromosome segregation protein Spo0J
MILARIIDLSGTNVLVAQIVENEQRDDMTPLEEAHAYHRLVEDLGGDVELAATKLGKMPWRITERTCRKSRRALRLRRRQHDRLLLRRPQHLPWGAPHHPVGSGRFWG